MATPQIIRYILYSPHLSPLPYLYTLTYSPSTFPYLPIPFSPSLILSSHLFLLLSLLPIPIYPYTFPIPSSHFSSPIFSHLPYHAVQCPYTPYSPLPIHCPISLHTRPCNLSVLLYTILCTLTYSPPIIPCET